MEQEIKKITDGLSKTDSLNRNRDKRICPKK